MGIWLLLGMFNLLSFFRAINLDNNPYKYGSGSFYKVVGPLGFLVGLKISDEDMGENKVPWIIGIIFSIVLALIYFIF